MQITLKDIAAIPLFSPFLQFPWKLKSLMEKARILKFDADSIVIREGDKDEGALFVVLSGFVIIAKTIDAETGRAKALARLRAGEFFGEMSLFDDSVRSASVIAGEETYLLEVSKHPFDELVTSDVEVPPALLSGVIQAISNRLRRTNMELVVLYDTGKIISRNQRLADMCQGILQRLSSSLMTGFGLLFIFNELSDSYDSVAKTGDFDLSLEQKVWSVATLESHKLGFRFPEDSLSNTELSLPKPYMMLTPLVRKGMVYGAIILARDDRPFTDAEFNLAAGVSQQASFAVENARNREEEAAKTAYNKRRQR
jgi:CRP-like cAMP-binding protein